MAVGEVCKVQSVDQNALDRATSSFQVDAKEGVVMVATFVVSLAWTVKEGLAAGFALGLTLTIYGLANPNLAVVGKSAGRAQLLFE